MLDAATGVDDATGTEPLTYQWHRVGVGDLTDDGRITGSSTATLTINPTQVADTGDYRVSVSDRCNGTTDSATVRVVIHAPLTGGSPILMRILEEIIRVRSTDERL